MSEERAEYKTDCMFVGVDVDAPAKPLSLSGITPIMNKCHGQAVDADTPNPAAWTDGTPGIEFAPSEAWGSPAKATPLEDIKALIAKSRDYAMAPEIAWDPVRRVDALVLALEQAIGIIESYEMVFSPRCMGWKGKPILCSEYIRKIARGEHQDDPQKEKTP